MSWNGTVRCGHCYNPGHNRLGCPERRKKALAAPESYEGRKWHREQEARKAAIAKRVCSYCEEPNHNRRGCKSLKRDKELILHRQKQFQADFKRTAQQVGLSVGSLIKVPAGHHHDDEGVWSRGYVTMIIDPVWQNIDFTLQDCNASNTWGLRDRTLFTSRVVTTFGYGPEDSNGWRRAPQHNDKLNVSVVQIHKFMKDLFHPETDFGSNTDEAALLLAPSASHLPEGPSELPTGLVSTFHLDPDKRADAYDKRRLADNHSIWSGIYPGEKTGEQK